MSFAKLLSASARSLENIFLFDKRCRAVTSPTFFESGYFCVTASRRKDHWPSHEVSSSADLGRARRHCRRQRRWCVVPYVLAGNEADPRQRAPSLRTLPQNSRAAQPQGSLSQLPIASRAEVEKAVVERSLARAARTLDASPRYGPHVVRAAMGRPAPPDHTLAAAVQQRHW